MRELEQMGDGASGISISAQGQVAGAAGGTRTLSIWLSGNAAPIAKVEPAPLPPALPPEPPVPTEKPKAKTTK